MLKRYSEFFKSLMLLNDLVFLSFAWWLAYLSRFHSNFFYFFEPYVFRHYLIAWILILLVWSAVFLYFDLYRPRRISTHLGEAADLLKGSLLALLVFLGMIFLLREIVLSRIVVVLFWVLSVVFLSLSHIIVREALRFFRRRGYNVRYVMAVGDPLLVKRLIHKLEWHRHLGLKVVGAHFIGGLEPANDLKGVELLKSRDELLMAIRLGRVDQVFVALPFSEASKLREIQSSIGDEPVTIYYVPDFGEFVKLSGKVEEFDDLHIITLQGSPLMGWNSILKRTLDLAVGSLALTLFSPLMVLIALGIKLTSRGPILYRQERMGLDGRRFEMLKFRTMVEDAERTTGPIWALPEDVRITPLGYWLRRISLDELPQLFNVLRGDMSLVGPRPERPALIEQFRKSIPKYMLRLKVKAGMTGWAQVNGWRGNTSLEKRVEHDIKYIESWSLWGDLKILALTLLRGFSNKAPVDSS